MNNNEKLKIRSFTNILSDRTPEPTHIIGGGILPRKALLLITGQAKAQKSFLVQNLAIAISSGISFACFKINEHCKVLILSAEGGYYSNRDRLQIMARSQGKIIDTNLNICFDSRIKLDNEDDVSLLKEKISEHKPDVLIIDPLVKFNNKDENSSSEMGPILNTLRDLIEDYNISIILVHHQGKDQSKGARGTSAIQGEYDSQIQITKKKDGHILDFDLRHSAPMDDLQIQFNAGTYWFEQSDDHPLITLVKEMPGEPRKHVAERAVERKLYKTRGSVYKKLQTMIANKSIYLTGDKLYPGNSPVSILHGD